MDDSKYGFLERSIAIACVTSTDFLQKIRREWDPLFLESVSARQVTDWCIEYYDEYRKAPGRQLQLLFDVKKTGLRGEEAEDLEDLLHGLSQESKKNGSLDVEHLVDQTRQHFRRQRLRRIVDEGQRNLDSSTPDSLDDLEKSILSYVPSHLKDKSAVINPFLSRSVVAKAFEARPKPIIQYGKALRRFWGSQFTRDAFIAFLAPEKRGKSWHLWDIAKKGVESGLGVVFFQAGDMSERQQQLRMYCSISGRRLPTGYEEDEYEDEGVPRSTNAEVFYPTIDCALNQTGDCTRSEREDNDDALYSDKEWDEAVENDAEADLLKHCSKERRDWQPCTACPMLEPRVWFRYMPSVPTMTEKEAYKAVKKWKKRCTGSLRLATYANETLSMSEVKSRIEEWEREGFKTDLVVIDYADILAPDPDTMRIDHRHQVNKIWQRMRRLSEEKNCLVVTATQAAASSYDKNLIRISDFSEDKRKFSHVTAMYGLNQTSSEKKLGIMRINQLVVREGDFNVQNVVHVLQCLSVGKPVVTSF